MRGDFQKWLNPALQRSGRTKDRDQRFYSKQEPFRGRRQCTAGEAAAFGEPQAVLPPLHVAWPNLPCPARQKG